MSDDDRDLRIYLSGWVSGVATLLMEYAPTDTDHTQAELREMAKQHGREGAHSIVRDPAARQSILDAIREGEETGEEAGTWLGVVPISDEGSTP